jgi:hypothetical protein
MTSTMPRASGKRGPQSRLPSRWVALALLASAQLMLVLDVTVVNVALPDIGAALRLQRGELPWVMTICTVFFGGLMLLGGRIADLSGARRMTLAGLALFAPSPWERPARWPRWRSQWHWSRPSARSRREGNRRCQASRQ